MACAASVTSLTRKTQDIHLSKKVKASPHESATGIMPSSAASAAESTSQRSPSCLFAGRTVARDLVGRMQGAHHAERWSLSGSTDSSCNSYASSSSLSSSSSSKSNDTCSRANEDAKPKTVAMDTEELEVPLSLPDTQNADSQCFTQSQDTIVAADSEPRIWGRLCPFYKFPLFQLTKDEFTFGRHTDCDVCVKNVLPYKRELTISKVHFKIYREKCVTSSGLEDDVVYLKDESQNGTFVNNKLVGKGNSVVLVNNDLIAVAKNSFKIYVYMSTSGYDDSFLPDELKIKYAVSRTLGTGACGEVKLCFSKSGLEAGKKYAMKLIPKVKVNASGQKNIFNDENHIMNEVLICKKLKHPCIISIMEFFNSPSMVYIILELMEGGELFERIKKYNGLSEQNAKFIFYQVVLAVNYLHENDITHRDLKPENILLADDSDETIVKVSDFGLSKFVDSQTMMKTFCGTPMYVAPEILTTGGRGSYSNKVDVWSLGVILYCSLSGLTPFRINDKVTPLYDQIRKGKYNFNSSKFFNVSINAKDLIRKMMTVDPAKRISIKMVLAHPWLNDMEMQVKVHGLLGLSNRENILPIYASENVETNRIKYKRARLE